MTAPVFPPAPWQLTGDMIISVWRIPAAELPPWPLPPGSRPWITRRRSTLVTFWVDYRGEGVLSYREFLIAQAVRHGHRTAVSTVAAWVDDEQALHGGRTLWGIPKQLGTINLQAGAGRTHAELLLTDAPPVRAVHRTALQLPVRVPARAHLVQQLPDGAACRVPLRISGRPGIGRTRLTTGPSTPVSFLDGHRPLLSLTMRGFRSTVGHP
ncbi:acetoacetate decarboxylase family protein [Streptomyces sp. CG1]|uniref:acetoacetate decarboxylase family protein n=1 Tax=Streptomyces sp. CG1 TaxID=1287523 RepID=UPI0034E2B612